MSSGPKKCHEFFIQKSQYIRPKVTFHKCAGIIRTRVLFKGEPYMRKYGSTMETDSHLKPNYFKKQCSSSSFLLAWSRYTGPKWPLNRLVLYLKCTALACSVLHGHFGLAYSLRWEKMLLLGVIWLYTKVCSKSFASLFMQIYSFALRSIV